MHCCLIYYWLSDLAFFNRQNKIILQTIYLRISMPENLRFDKTNKSSPFQSRERRKIKTKIPSKFWIWYPDSRKNNSIRFHIGASHSRLTQGGNSLRPFRLLEINKLLLSSFTKYIPHFYYLYTILILSIPYKNN